MVFLKKIKHHFGEICVELQKIFFSLKFDYQISPKRGFKKL
jgi:hypothetical protein